MILFGLDPSTNTGYALSGHDGRIFETGKWSPKAKWSKKSNQDADTINARVGNEARRWIMSMIRIHGIEAVGIEDLTPFNTKPGDEKPMFDPTKNNKLNSIQAGLRMGCEDLSVPFYAFPPSTWRKSFLGHGKKLGRSVLKAEAKAMCEMMKIPAKNEDAREAAGVLFHLQCVLRHPRHQAGNAGPLFKSENAA